MYVLKAFDRYGQLPSEKVEPARTPSSRAQEAQFPTLIADLIYKALFPARLNLSS